MAIGGGYDGSDEGEPADQRTMFFDALLQASEGLSTMRSLRVGIVVFLARRAGRRGGGS